MFGRKRRKPGTFTSLSLGTRLLQLSPDDWWTLADACEGTQVFGGTGSGKTSGSGQAIARSMLAHGFGGLVLTAKPDECDLWRKYADSTGRSDDLVVFGADHPHRFNFMEYELARGGGSRLTENLVALLATVLEATEGGEGSQSNDPFWGRALKQLLRNTIDLLVLSTGKISLSEMSALIGSARQRRDRSRMAVRVALLATACRSRVQGPQPQ